MELNKILNLRVNEHEYDLFMRKYPKCISRFIRNAMSIALKDRDFFEKVYFSIDTQTNNY